MSNIVIRSVRKEDHPFIYATYLNNNWYSKDNASTLKKETWMRLQHGRLEHLLGEAKALVACLEEDRDVILGYVMLDELPYIYIKQAWRAEDLGLTKMLLKQYEEYK